MRISLGDGDGLGSFANPLACRLSLLIHCVVVDTFYRARVEMFTRLAG